MDLRVKSEHIHFILITALALTTVIPMTMIFAPRVLAQSTPTVMVTGYSGVSQNFSLTDLQTMPPTSGYGGFYQPNQKQINSGNWTGVSLNYLCSQIAGGITSTCTISVFGQGTNNFTYEMVANGTNLNSGYATYNNATGLTQNQTQPITILLAYMVNGSALSPSIGPAPRLVTVGPEGLLMIGTGGKSITQVTITNTAQTPTPTPSATPTPTPSPTPTSAPTVTSPPTSAPTATPTPTTAATPTPTPAATTPTQIIATPTITSSPKTTETPAAAPTTSAPQPTTAPSPTPTLTATFTPTPTPDQIQGTILFLGASAATIIVAAVAVAYILKRTRKTKKTTG